VTDSQRNTNFNNEKKKIPNDENELIIKYITNKKEQIPARMFELRA